MLHQKMEQVEKLGTETEQSRFLVANKDNVKDRDQAIANYLQWRQEYLPRARALSESSPAASRWFGFIEDKQHKPLRSKTNPESRLVLACGGYHLCEQTVLHPFHSRAVQVQRQVKPQPLRYIKVASIA